MEREAVFSELEKSVVGELMNISIGNAVTSLGILLNNLIHVTTPNVELLGRGDMIWHDDKETVITRVDFVSGVCGYTVMFLGEEQARILTDLMMGGDGYGEYYQKEISDIHFSAISEAMNQITGAVATSLAGLLDVRVNISVPVTEKEDTGNYMEQHFPGEERFVKISFRLQLGEATETEIAILYPYSMAGKIIEYLIDKHVPDRIGNGADEE